MCHDNDEVLLNLNAANERLIAAEYLIEKALYPDAVNRGYYAMFHAAIAILIVRGVLVKTHSGLISKFGQELIQTGQIDRMYGKMLANAEELREKADYSLASTISKEQAVSLICDAKSFVKMAHNCLK